mgnify:CR=1 FL=1|jgi:hypothetical protein
MLRTISLAGLLTLVVIVPAAAQQMGRQPYGSARNPSIAAQFQHADRIQRLENDGAQGRIQQFVTNYTSTSTSVGNLNEITQTLGDGATGTVMSDSGQTSDGSQTSDAETQLQVTNRVQTDKATALVRALEGAVYGQ